MSSGIIDRWNAIPLYLQILMAMIAGAVTGLILGPKALFLEIPSKIILQLLGALAPPLILIAVIHVLMTTEIKGRTALRLSGLLLLNTTVAIVIGLFVANVIKPGAHRHLDVAKKTTEESKGIDPVDLLVQNVPKSLLGPLGDRQDWFLDRCRTTINVLGDVNVSCMLDGREKQTLQID